MTHRWLGALLTLLLLAASPAAARDRVVALGGDITEIVNALGQGARLVAVDDTSTFPAAVEKLPKLGYLRSLAPEPILAQRPTLVLASSGAGPDAVLRQLERAGVAIVTVPDEASAAGVAAKVRTIAAALGVEDRGDALANRIIAGLPRAQPENPPAMMLVLANAPGRIMAAGQGTAGDGFIRLAGGRNSFTADGYKPLSAEAALAAAPAILIIPSHILSMAGGLDALKRDPILSRTPAVRNNRVLVVDSASALNFGPRLPDAVATIRRQLGTN